MFSIVKAQRIPLPSVPVKSAGPPDLLLITGFLVALGALIAGVALTGAGLHYFLQPTAAAIVLGGTLGILLITTPIRMIGNSFGRVASLFSRDCVDPGLLVDEIVQVARNARKEGPSGLQRAADQIQDPFLRESLLLALDLESRCDLQAAIETEVRLRERQGEADAKTLEVAGGFAATVCILGTVVGLIEVLRNFSDFPAVGAGIGTAFVSTIYGLALANLFLLPLAHRIRATVAETFEVQELVLEGVLCVNDGLHPSLIRLRLGAFLRESKAVSNPTASTAITAAVHG